MSPRVKHGFLHDEQGDRSSMRFWLCFALPFTLAIIALDAGAGWDVPQAAYALLTAVNLALIAGAAGPRMARYLAPAVRAAAEAVGRPNQPHEWATGVPDEGIL